MAIIIGTVTHYVGDITDAMNSASSDQSIFNMMILLRRVPVILAMYK